jgi:hypothetical protein
MKSRRRVNSTVMRLTHLFTVLREATLIFLLFGLTACGFFVGPKDIKLSEATRGVADARKLIAEQRANPSKPILQGDEVPESLRFPALRWVIIETDHVDLVVYHDPDVTRGARIWSLDAKRQHEDKPTRYPDVYFYDYNNDAPQSPDNLP